MMEKQQDARQSVEVFGQIIITNKATTTIIRCHLPHK